MGRGARGLWGTAVVGAIALALAIAPGGDAVAATDWKVVSLGRHQFGHLSTPDAIVAVAGADDVGWDNPPEGSQNGPWSFDVGADGAVWLLDQNESRLLAWDSDDPRHIARTVRLPTDVIRVAADLAVGADGTIYVTFLPATDGERHTLHVAALSPSGELRWDADTDIEIFNSRLRIGPDGAVYWEGGEHGTWTPVSTPDGRPLSLAEQRAGASKYQPMPGGLRFDERLVGEGDSAEWRFTLLDGGGRTVGAWRLTSDDELGGSVDEPGWVDGEPAVVVGVDRQTQDDFLYEYIALRLPDGDARPTIVSLDPRAVWGDVPITGVRVGPDGALYQLRSDIDTGVTIARYALAAGTPPPTSPSPSASATATASPTPTSTPSASVSGSLTTPAASPSPTATISLAPAGSRSSGPMILAVSLIAGALIGLGLVFWFWRRTPRSGETPDGLPPRDAPQGSP